MMPGALALLPHRAVLGHWNINPSSDVRAESQPVARYSPMPQPAAPSGTRSGEPADVWRDNVRCPDTSHWIVCEPFLARAIGSPAASAGGPRVWRRVRSQFSSPRCLTTM